MVDEESPTEKTVVVVGAGIVGIACAHYLNKAGFAVTVVDRATIAGACSHGNCGYICPSHVLPLTEPAAIKLAIKSLFKPNAPFRVKPRLSPAMWNWMWQFLRRCNTKQMLYAGQHLQAILDSSINEYRDLVAAESLQCEWKESGLAYILQTDHGMQEFSEGDKFLTEHFGVSAQRIEGKDLPDFDPALKPGLAGAFYYTCDASVRPDRLNADWVDRLRSKGVTFLEGCDVTGVVRQNGQIVKLNTNQQDLNAAHFVFAAGALSTKFEKHLGCRIPIEPGKGYSVTMQRPEICPKYPMLFPEHKVGVSPFDKGYRLGSMMEFAGYDSSIPARRIQQLRNSAEPYLINPHTDEIHETWYGWRPMTWDSLPIIGAVPRLANGWLATGHNMLGVSLATATGRLIAEMIQGQPTHIDASAFSPSPRVK